MSTVIPTLAPLNDFAVLVRLFDVETPSGDVVPLTDADDPTVTAFFATAADPDATAADPALVCTVVYTGADGDWLVTLDAAALTPTRLATAFATAAPYLIIETDSGVRAALKCKYQKSVLLTASA